MISQELVGDMKGGGLKIKVQKTELGAQIYNSPHINNTNAQTRI